MKQQVIVVHGGDAYASYEDFLTNLVRMAISLEWLHGKDWKSSLAERLGDGYDVILPRMPNAQNAKYLEWKVWFEKYLPLVEDGVILIGHSLGASFLAKYLSEEPVTKHIRATFLVAPPFDTDGERPLVEFNQTTDLAGLRTHGGALFLYHSEDDPIVAFAELSKFTNRLPEATIRTFTDRGHFNQSEFPELLADLRSATG